MDKEAVRAMIRAGDVVLYGVDGICHVTGVTTRQIAGRAVEYFVLKSIGTENSIVYVPANNEALVSKMQRLLSLNEILELIRAIPDEDEIWIEDDAKRLASYNRIAAGKDRLEILLMIKALYTHERELKQKGRKMRAADLRLMKEAERRLYDEFAHVLRIEPGQVLPFILRQIGETGAQRA